MKARMLAVVVFLIAAMALILPVIASASLSEYHTHI